MLHSDSPGTGEADQEIEASMGYRLRWFQNNTNVVLFMKGGGLSTEPIPTLK